MRAVTLMGERGALGLIRLRVKPTLSSLFLVGKKKRFHLWLLRRCTRVRTRHSLNHCWEVTSGLSLFLLTIGVPVVQTTQQHVMSNSRSPLQPARERMTDKERQDRGVVRGEDSDRLIPPSHFVHDKMAEPVVIRADLLTVEKQNLPLYIELQHSNTQSQPNPPSHASSPTPVPAVCLADEWQLSPSPLTPSVTSSSDDYFGNHLNDRVIIGKHFQPSFSLYSVTSDCYTIQCSSQTPVSSYDHQLASLDQPSAASPKRSHNQTTQFDDLLSTKRLCVELSASHHLQHKKAVEHESVALQAQCPLLSSELVEDFSASTVNVGSQVMGGLDGSELGLAMNSSNRQASETSGSEKAGVGEQAFTRQQVALQPSTPQQTLVSTSSSPASSVPFEPLSSSSVLTTFSSSGSSYFDHPSSLSDLTNHVLPSDTKGEGKRLLKRILADRKRRSKIADELKHLRSLIGLHGNNTSDQTSVIISSVDLVQQLVNERGALKDQLRTVSDERVGLEREQQLAIDRQRQIAAVLSPSLLTTLMAAADKPISPDLSALLHHLRNILTPVLGSGRSDSETDNNGGGVAGEQEQLLLSQYFLHTLKLLTNLPHNNHA